MLKLTLIAFVVALMPVAFAQNSKLKSCDDSNISGLKQTVKDLQNKMPELQSVSSFKVVVQGEGVLYGDEDSAIELKTRLENVFQTLKCKPKLDTYNRKELLAPEAYFVGGFAICPARHEVKLVSDQGDNHFVKSWVHVIVDGIYQK